MKPNAQYQKASSFHARLLGDCLIDFPRDAAH